MPQGLGLGGDGGQKFKFLNMVMWHIKLKGMNSRPGYTENILPKDQTGDLLEGVKGSNTIRYLPERGDLQWRAIECVLVL